MAELTAADRERIERAFVRWLALVVVALAFIPAFYALVRTPAGSSYLGFEYNTDDHMVYAAWMRQAMDGHVLMDNRFTSQPQPGLTIHVYFFILGLLAKIIGIAFAAAIGRAVFGVLFVFLAARLLKRLSYGVYGNKLALTLVVFGAGIGFLLWQRFGIAIDKPAPDFLNSFLLGQLPIDVWQPEGFVFPSMLTNGLFMVSLCLILYIYECFLRAREDAAAMLPGFAAMAVLMNIHTYDVLTIGLVMCGFIAAAFHRRQVTGPWLGRSVVIAAGVVIPALWFMHVLRVDPVFQARAATLTYSPGFRQVFSGYLVMMVLGLAAAAWRASQDPEAPRRNYRYAGVALAILLFLTLLAAAGSRTSGYFLSAPEWIVAFAAAIVAVALWADSEPGWNLIFAWAVVGSVAIYFPGLFQRKLTMGLSIPWAILSAGLIAGLVSGAERYRRNLSTVLAVLVMGASSILWLFRDTQYVRANVANTTRHPVFLSPDERRIIDTLNGLQGRNVLLALPGVGAPAVDQETGQPVPDEFVSPVLPDMAPICSGLTGIYSYAGHWSETPDYGRKTGDMYRFFLRQPFQSVRRVMSPEERTAFVSQNSATYALMPSPQTFTALPLVTPSDLGEVVYQGAQFTLVKLRR